MVIEKDLKDNTAALKANTEILQKLYDLKTDNVTPAAPVAAPAQPAAPVPATMSPPTAQTAPAAQPAAPAPVAAPADVSTLKSDEEMNNILITEFKRLGGREKIDDVMTSMGVTGVTGLTAEVQQQLITAVQAIQL